MQAIERMIQSLQLLQKHKETYVYPLDVASVENFLNGFRSACAACGFEIPRKIRWKTIEGRGWKPVAAGPAPQMKAKGMADDAILDELIEIEMEQLRRLAKTREGEAPAAP
jgi:hypothetical protein